MNSILFWIIMFFIMYYKLIVTNHIILGYAYKRKMKLVLLFLLGFIGFVFYQRPNNPTELYTTVVLVFVVGIVVSLQLQGNNRILGVILAYAIVTIFEMIVTISVRGVLNISSNELLMNYSINLLLNTTSFIPLFILWVVKRKLKKKNLFTFVTVRKSSMLLLMTILFGLVLYVVPILMFGMESASKSVIQLYSLASALIVSLIFIGLYRLQKANEDKSHFEEVSKLSETIMQQQEQYYHSLLEKENDTRKFRHDIKNHLISLKYLLDKGRYDELDEYLNSLNDSILDLSPQLNTGNDIVNIMINEIIVENGYKSIFKWKGFLPKNIKVTSIDLCTIFSNLLLNASEAISNDKVTLRKMIKVKVNIEKSNLLIGIENTIGEEVLIQNNSLVSTKSDKRNHGLGSQNMEMVINKYNGNINYQCDEKMFRVYITIPNVFKIDS